MDRLKRFSTRNLWFIVGLVATIISVPNGTFIKVASNALDPFMINALRFLAIVAVTLPYMIWVRRRFTKKNLGYAVAMGICMTLAVFSYVQAIALSGAAYVSVISLLIPILFIIYSMLMTGERIRRRSVQGIVITALGAICIVLLPFLFTDSKDVAINPLATIYALVDVILFPLALIFSRKANDNGLPIMATFGVSSTIVAVASITLACVFSNPTQLTEVFSSHIIVAILYSAVIVALISRTLTIASYERIGSVASGGLSYLEQVLSIVFPIIILREFLPPYVFIGGALILLGLYLTQSKRHQWHLRFTKHH